MADLTEINSSQSVKIIGSDSTGFETNPINGTSLGELSVIDSHLTDGSQITNINGSLTKTSITATASGDTTIVSPPAGKKIRLYKFGYSADGLNALGTVVGLKFGVNAVIDKQNLQPAQPYADGLTMRYYDGGIDEVLKVNLSLSVTVGVYVNVAYQFL